MRRLDGGVLFFLRGDRSGFSRQDDASTAVKDDISTRGEEGEGRQICSSRPIYYARKT